MLLRRLVRNLRKQEWSVLGIEFVVVVVGIFLGLQVDGWNEARKERRAEGVYLERLAADMDEMIEANAVRERQTTRLRSALFVLESLDRCELAEADRELFEFAIVSHQGMRRFVIIRATYDEMVGSGALARLGNIELKNAVSALFAEADAAEDMLRYFSADLGRASDIIWQSVSLFVERDGPPPAAMTDEELLAVQVTETVRYDFDALCRNAPFRNAMVEVVDSNTDRLRLSGELQTRLQEVKQLIGQALEDGAG